MNKAHKVQAAKRAKPPLKTDRHFVTALARGLEVLACFRHGDRMLGNQELSKRCGLAKSTVSRLTHTLTRLGYLIYVEESVTPNEIGTLIHTANPTVTSMLNALERDGLVVREQHPEDGRSSVVTLTARGKALYEKAFLLHHDPIEETMAVLSANERTKLVDILVRLGDSFEASTGKKKRKSR